jgi:hypothetical protein
MVWKSSFLLSFAWKLIGMPMREGGKSVLNSSHFSPRLYVIQCLCSPSATATWLSNGLFKMPMVRMSSTTFQLFPASTERKTLLVSNSARTATSESSK